jgi:hypothetical protein
MPVRLLDLSSDGLLLACERPLTIAATPRVVAWLAGRRLEVELVVRHVSSRWVEKAGGYLVGGCFPALEPSARLTIKALLATTEPLGAGGPPSRVRRDRPRPERNRGFADPYEAPAAFAGEPGLGGSADPPPQPA